MLLRCAVLATLLLSGQAPAQDSGSVVREVLRRGDYQTELPGRRESVRRSERSVRSDNDEGDRPEGDASGGRPRESGRISVSVGDGVGLLLWLLLGVVAVIFFAHLLARARGRHRDVELERVSQDGVATDVPASIALPPVDEAERLARDGRYGEAIRVLLHNALAAVSRAGSTRIAPSWTSREVLRTVEIPAGADAPLHALVAAEERSLFARRPAGRDEYETCAAQYRALLRAGSVVDE